MFEKCKKSIDKEETFAALLTDLSKAFNCLLHDLIIARPNAYLFGFSSAILIHSCFSDKDLRTQLILPVKKFSFLYFLGRSSILGPILFNIFICLLFSVAYNIDFANYADDITLYLWRKY